MTPEIVYMKTKRQSPDERLHCLRATGMNPLRLDRWLNQPNDNPLTAEELDALTGWAKGEFGYMSTGGGGYIRMPRAHVEPVMLGVRPAPVATGKRYEPGVVEGMSTVTKQGDGRNLPGADELKIKAAKERDAKREAELQAKRKAEKTGFLPGITIPLMTFGRG